MDVPTQIYGLMAVAEEHQNAVAAALECLEKERAALDALRRDLNNQSVAMNAARKETVSTIQNATEAATRDAVARSIAGVAHVVVDEFRANWRPFLTEVDKSTDAMSEAAAKVRSTTTWFAWRWLALMATFVVGLLLLASVATTAAIAWQRNEISALRRERVALASEVAKLQEQADAWAAKGGRARLEVCGAKLRLCVRVDKKDAYGVDADYYVLRGY
jgi:cell division protein FtsB